MKLTKATVGKQTLPAGKSEVIVLDEDMPGFGLRLRAGGSAVWVAQYRVGAKQRDRARRAAREVLAKADLGHGAQAERRERQAKALVTLGAVIQLYLKRVQATRKPKTLIDCKRYFEHGWRPFQAKSIHEISRRDVAVWLIVIAEDNGPIGSNRGRATLSVFYSWAIAQGIADLNPVIGTSRVGTERPRERVVSPSEMRDIWKATKDDVARTRHLWADIDGRDDLTSRLNGDVPPPTAVVESGGGLNVWWELNSAIKDRIEIETGTRWLSDNLGDDHCWSADQSCV